MTLRSNYEEELRNLDVELVKMGNRVEKAIKRAKEAFLNGDVKLAKEVVDKDTKINANEREIEALCFHLMLREAPVATDLRVVTTDLKVVTDLERIGDQVADLCELLSEGRHYTKADLLVPLFNTTQVMIYNVLYAYVGRDLDAAKVAAKMDDQVDTYYYDVKDELIKELKENTIDVDEAIDLLMTAKHLERAGDHATNIYEWLEFMTNGKLEDVQ